MPVGWQDSPSTATPISAANLRAMDGTDPASAEYAFEDGKYDGANPASAEAVYEAGHYEPIGLSAASKTYIRKQSIIFANA